MSITNGSVVMLYIKTMKLQYELAFPKQSFVLASAVITPATQQALVPLAAGLDVCDGDEGLRSHRFLPWCLSLPWVLYVIRFSGCSTGFVTWINRYTSLTIERSFECYRPGSE